MMMQPTPPREHGPAVFLRDYSKGHEREIQVTKFFPDWATAEAAWEKIVADEPESRDFYSVHY